MKTKAEMSLMTRYTRDITTINGKKEYLKSYQGSRKRIAYIADEIQRLKADMKPPTIVADKWRKEPYADFPEYYAIISGEIEEMKAEQAERINHCQNIEKQIREVADERERGILVLRYIKGMKWEDVAAVVNYSIKRVHGIHVEALEHLRL